MLVTDAVYGPTRRFCDHHLTRLGVDVSYYDPLAGAAIEREFRPNTRIVFAESPGSLTFDVQDIPAIAAVAHAHGALVIADNSWATPFVFRSFDHGVDVSVHAATKYIGGHSDVLLGLIVANEATYRAAAPAVDRHGRRPRRRTTASSALRGLRTLAVRLERHQASALAIAQWLRARPEVQRGDLSGACRARAATSCGSATSPGASGLFGVVLQPVAKARDRRDARRHAPVRHGLELGRLRKPDHPDLSGAHAHGDAVGRRAGRACVCTIGLEDPEDLIADLADGFARLGA